MNQLTLHEQLVRRQGVDSGDVVELHRDSQSLSATIPVAGSYVVLARLTGAAGD